MEKNNSREKVNNEFYNHLGENWFLAQDDPIALLRAESKIKNPWVADTILKEFGASPKKILDIGCGAGFLSNYLSGLGHEVFGIDLSEESLKIARKYDATKKVNYQFGDAYKLPFPDKSFDVVCAMDFLEHVEEPHKVILEASRVLKPGGLFYFHTFNRNFLSYILVIKFVEWFLPKTPKNLHILRLFITPKELEKMCELSGLEVNMQFGIRPKFMTKAFWKSLFSREVERDFCFTFTNSTLLSFIGYAKKDSTQN